MDFSTTVSFLDTLPLRFCLYWAIREGRLLSKTRFVLYPQIVSTVIACNVLGFQNVCNKNSNVVTKHCAWWFLNFTTQWYILKSRILLLIWVHFGARMLLLKVIYRIFGACILLLKVIYRFFGACILPRKYIRAQNWTQLAQSNIRYFKM